MCKKPFGWIFVLLGNYLLVYIHAVPGLIIKIIILILLRFFISYFVLLYCTVPYCTEAASIDGPRRGEGVKERRDDKHIIPKIIIIEEYKVPRV